MLGSRYVNLHQCTYYSPTVQGSITYAVADTANPGPFGAGTNTSGIADTSVTCQPGIGGEYEYQPENSGVQALDLLDPTRGQGFIQFSMTTPAVAATYPQTAQLVGPGTGDPTTAGSITIDVLTIPLIDPVVGLSAAGLAGMVTAGVALVRRRRVFAA